MENAIISLICVVLIVVGGMTLSQGFLTSADSSSMALEEQGNRDKDILRTELSPQSASVDGAGTTVNLTLENTGQTKLADFTKWDLIVQYFDSGGQYVTTWLPFTSGSLSDNEWKVNGIDLNGVPETYDQSILNPGETVEILAQLDPPVGDNTTNMIVASTPNGIPVSIYFVK